MSTVCRIGVKYIAEKMDEQQQRLDQALTASVKTYRLLEVVVSSNRLNRSLYWKSAFIRCSTYFFPFFSE